MAKLRNSTTVFLVGNIEPTMAWYQRLGFESQYFPPGFATLRRDDIEIFVQHSRDIPHRTIPGGVSARRGTSIY